MSLNIYMRHGKYGENKVILGGKGPNIRFINQKGKGHSTRKVVGGKKKTGRYGMELWHILVLATVRMGLDANYDRLEDFANHHSLIRQIMGVETGNVSLLDVRRSSIG